MPIGSATGDGSIVRRRRFNNRTVHRRCEMGGSPPDSGGGLRPEREIGWVRPDHTVEITIEQEFAAPPEAVFDWLQTPANWLSLKDVREATGTGRAGSIIEIDWGRHIARFTVVEYDRPRRVVNVAEAFREELTFSASGSGTRVTSVISWTGLEHVGRMERWAAQRTMAAQNRAILKAMAHELQRRKGDAAPGSGAPGDEPPVGPYFE